MGMALGMDQKVFLETGGDILHGGYVHVDGFVPFAGDIDDLEEVEYIDADDVATVLEDAGVELSAIERGKGVVTVKELDTLEAALECEAARENTEDGLPVLVLNFACAFQAGGGVVISSHTQEGELCRRSTLFASLTADEGRAYYDDNQEVGGSLYTHGVLVHPYVEVFRRRDNITLDTPFVVAAISVSAPFVHGKRNDGEEVRALLAERIEGMLKVALAKGYRHLVLGAWGCGTNGNDPKVVARAFHEALDKPVDDTTLAGLFDSVTFAILDTKPGQPNLTAFRSEFES